VSDVKRKKELFVDHKLPIHSKKPCWDVPREGLQHEAIEKEHEFVEMCTQQEAFKKKAAIQRKVNEKRIDDMHQTQTKLREKFIQVNEFMKECLAKATRAENQIAVELEQQESLQKETTEIEKDLNELSGFAGKFENIIKELQPYEDVFNVVIDDPAVKFSNFDELTSQCDALSKQRSFFC